MGDIITVCVLARIQVIAPVYNEGESLRDFHAAVRAATRGLPSARVSILLVNDGSTDNTLEVLRDIAQRDPDFQYISLSRNCGHQTAVTCGIDHADGDAVVLMDADLQDDPEAIPALVGAWRAGRDVVVVERGQRGESFLFRLGQAAFYRLYQACSGFDALNFGTFCLLSRRALRAVRRYRERERYLPGLVRLVGYSFTTIVWDRLPRASGESKVGWRGLFRLALNALLSFSLAPIRTFSCLGLVLAALSVAATLAIVGLKISDWVGGTGRAIPGWASVMCVVLFIGGMQLLCTAILGEYVGRIHSEVVGRPMYHVDGASSRSDAVAHVDPTEPPPTVPG